MTNKRIEGNSLEHEQLLKEGSSNLGHNKLVRIQKFFSP